jgi:hypothetical protein
MFGVYTNILPLQGNRGEEGDSLATNIPALSGLKIQPRVASRESRVALGASRSSAALP